MSDVKKEDCKDDCEVKAPVAEDCKDEGCEVKATTAEDCKDDGCEVKGASK